MKCMAYKIILIKQVSHEKKPYYFPLYWLVNRDPYNGLLWFIIIPIYLGSIIPCITQPTRVFFIAQVGFPISTITRVLVTACSPCFHLLNLTHGKTGLNIYLYIYVGFVGGVHSLKLTAYNWAMEKNMLENSIQGMNSPASYIGIVWSYHNPYWPTGLDGK